MPMSSAQQQTHFALLRSGPRSDLLPDSGAVAYPLACVQEIHLAGNDPQTDEAGRPLLIDTHDRPVEDAVWYLYELAVRLVGPVPTLIEWDSHLPTWSTLAAEAKRAETVMSANQPEKPGHAAVC